MSLIWTIYWPIALAALLVGVLAGRAGFHQRKLKDDLSPADTAIAKAEYKKAKNKWLAIGFGAVLAIVALWHWPLGGGSRFAGRVETEVVQELRRVDTPEFTGRLARSPLSRTLFVSGNANPFQKDGFVRLLREVPGVSRVRWAGESRRFDLPLVIEAALLCLAFFGVGLFISWIVEIRRRVNAYWNW